MNTILLFVFRLLHIFSGALWVSVAIFFKFILNRAVEALGPESPKFRQSLNERNRFSVFMGVITVSALVSGFVLYYFASGGLNWAWVKTGPGIGFTTGAVAGILAFFVGGFGISKTTARLGALTKQAADSSGKVSSEMEREIASLQKTLKTAENIDYWLLVVAMIAMATARYW